MAKLAGLYAMKVTNNKDPDVYYVLGIVCCKL